MMKDDLLTCWLTPHFAGKKVKLTSVGDAVGDDPGLLRRDRRGERGGHGGERGRVLHGHVLHWDAGVALGLHVCNKTNSVLN